MTAGMASSFFSETFCAGFLMTAGMASSSANGTAGTQAKARVQADSLEQKMLRGETYKALAFKEGGWQSAERWHLKDCGQSAVRWPLNGWELSAERWPFKEGGGKAQSAGI